MITLMINLLGTPRFELNGVLVEFPTAKTLALAAYAAINPGKHSRESLTAVFWPELSSERANGALRTTIWRLKKCLGDWVETKRSYFEIRSAPGLWVDVLSFTQLLEKSRNHFHGNAGFNSLDYPHSRKQGRISCPGCLPLLDEAVSLYHSGFMAGFTLKDSPAFDHWQRNVTEQLHSNLCDALKRLIAVYGGQEQYEQAISCAQRWYSISPNDEEALRQLMWLHYLSGDRSAAVHLYQEFEAAELKPDQLEAEEATTYLLNTLQEKTTPRTHREPPSKTITPSKLVTLFNVPALLTPFVGRTLELKNILTILCEPACRFLTLTGTGGTGKTRLAIQAAMMVAENKQAQQLFSNGIGFVSLASITDFEHLPAIIAAALGFTFYGGDSHISQLVNYLHRKSFLLILDNLEHLTGSYSLILRMLEAAPNLKVLATSRNRLNVRGEWVLVVQGLDYPLPGELTPLDNFSAVRLFKESARRLDPAFFLREEDTPYLVRICGLLDGLPLGIEMAASWVRTTSLANIAAGIESSLDFLASDQLDIPERQKSLRAIFDYTWNKLLSQEQILLLKLSVYIGGFTREQAELIMPLSPMTLSDLTDKAILHRHTANRYHIAHLFQIYAREKLVNRPDLEHQARDEHARLFAKFVSERNDWLHGTQQIQAIADIRTNLDNVHAAWFWAAGQYKLEIMSSMLEPLSRVYTILGSFHEARELFSQAIQAIEQKFAPNSEAPFEIAHLYACLLSWKGRCCQRLGLVEEALTDINASLEIAIAQEDKTLLGQCYKTLGNLAAVKGEFEVAFQLLNKSLLNFQQSGDIWEIGYAYMSLGTVADGYIKSQNYYREALRIFRDLGDPWASASCLVNLADADMHLGEYSEARQLSLESLKTFERIGAKRSIAIGLTNVAQASALLEQYPVAKDYYERALEYFHEAGIMNDTGTIEILLSAVELHSGDRESGWARVIRTLQTTSTNPNLPLVLEILTVITEYKSADEPELCVELLSCVDQHPAAWSRTRARVSPLLNVVKSCLPNKKYQAAFQRGLTLDPLAAAESLLEQFTT